MTILASRLLDLVDRLTDRFFKRRGTIEGKTSYQWLFKGWDHHKAGGYEDALWYYDKALQIDPRLITVLSHKGDALVKLGRYDEALRCYDSVEQINPSASNRRRRRAAEEALQRQRAHWGPAQWEEARKEREERDSARRARRDEEQAQWEQRRRTGKPTGRTRGGQPRAGKATAEEWAERARAQRERARAEWRARSQGVSAELEYYEVLGVGPTASRAEIKHAYRRRMKEYHPDKYATDPTSVQEEALRKSKEINQAYEALRHKRV
jgi:DnaJ-domain-containing protein 1